MQAWRKVMAAYRRVYDSRHLPKTGISSGNRVWATFSFLLSTASIPSRHSPGTRSTEPRRGRVHGIPQGAPVMSLANHHSAASANSPLQFNSVHRSIVSATEYFRPTSRYFDRYCTHDHSPITHIYRMNTLC